MSARDELNSLKMFIRHKKKLRANYPSATETIYDKIQDQRHDMLVEYYERKIAQEEAEAAKETYTLQFKSEVKIK